MGLCLVTLSGWGAANFADDSDDDVAVNMYRLYMRGSNDVYLELIRDLDHPNSYSLEAWLPMQFLVPVRMHPKKTMQFVQPLGVLYPSRLNLVWLPKVELKQIGEQSVARGVRFGSSTLTTKLIPMIVRFSNSVSDELMIFDSDGEMMFSFPKFSNDSDRSDVLSRVKANLVSNDELLELAKTSLVGVKRPHPAMVQELYFSQSKELYEERVEQEKAALPEYHRLKTKLTNQVASDSDLRDLLKLLNERFPINYRYLSRSDLVGFSERYRFDFALMRQMHMDNFFRFATIADSRWVDLLDGLDRLEEHGVLDSERLWALIYGSNPDSKIPSLALEFVYAKWKAGKIDDLQFRMRVKSFLESKDIEERLMIAEILHADGLDKTFDDSMTFWRDMKVMSLAAGDSSRPEEIPESLWPRCQVLLRRF